MITIHNLVKKFGSKTAVNIPDLHIHRGNLIGLVGNNGAGKTTLFRLILDLMKPEEGYIMHQGDKVCDTENWKSHTSSFIDNRFLIEFLTAEEYLYFVGATYGLEKAQVQERLAGFTRFMNGEILKQKKYIREFSAGNKQKLGIIAAMMVRPELLILDEPFNFLDPSSQIEIRNAIKALHQETGATIIISSHNLNYTTDICNRMLLLEHGVLMQDLDNSQGEAVEALNTYFVQQTERN